jgi:amino acid permease
MRSGIIEPRKRSNGVLPLLVVLVFLWLLLDAVKKFLGLGDALLASLSLAIVFWIGAKLRS